MVLESVTIFFYYITYTFRYYTIHTNVCIVHYKMWFLCKVWFPYQTALEIQRICEDIFNDINTYVFVLWYNKQEKQISYDVFVLQMHPHRDLEPHTIFPLGNNGVFFFKNHKYKLILQIVFKFLKIYINSRNLLTAK